MGSHTELTGFCLFCHPPLILFHRQVVHNEEIHCLFAKTFLNEFFVLFTLSTVSSCFFILFNHLFHWFHLLVEFDRKNHSVKNRSQSWKTKRPIHKHNRQVVDLVLGKSEITVLVDQNCIVLVIKSYFFVIFSDLSLSVFLVLFINRVVGIRQLSLSFEFASQHFSGFVQNYALLKPFLARESDFELKGCECFAF